MQVKLIYLKENGLLLPLNYQEYISILAHVIWFHQSTTLSTLELTWTSQNGNIWCTQITDLKNQSIELQMNKCFMHSLSTFHCLVNYQSDIWSDKADTVFIHSILKTSNCLDISHFRNIYLRNEIFANMQHSR